MLARGCTRCVAQARGPASVRLRTSLARASPARRFSTSSAHGAGGAAAGSASSSGGAVGALAPFVSELDRMAPSFDVRGGDIRILRTPTDFYETLKVRRTWDMGHGAYPLPLRWNGCA